MSISKFELMLKTDNVYFFDSTEFEEIIHYYLDEARHSLAKKAIELGLEQHPLSITIKLLKVQVLIFDGDLGKASELLNEIHSISPSNGEVFMHRADIYSRKEQHRKAIQELFTAEKLIEDPFDAWLLLGKEYMYLDDYENALLYFTKCIDEDIEDQNSLYNLVFCYEFLDKFNECATFLKSYIDRNPYSEIAWFQLGRQYYKLKKYKEAVESYDYAILIDDSFVGAYIEKAKSLEKTGEYSQAIENYMITVRLDDPTSYVYLKIAKCFLKLGNIEKALAYAKNSVHEDPNLGKGWFLLSDIYFKDKQYEKALYAIEKALQIDESNIYYWGKYADINLCLHLYEKVVKALNYCIDIGGVGVGVYLSLADVLVYTGDLNQAMSTLIKGKKIFKESAAIEYRLCGLFMLLENDEYSLLHLKNALSIDFEAKQILENLFPSVYNNALVKSVIDQYTV